MRFQDQQDAWVRAQLEPDEILRTGNYKRHRPLNPFWQGITEARNMTPEQKEKAREQEREFKQHKKENYD